MYERMGRIAIYTGGLGIAYIALERVQILKGSVPAFIVLWILLVLSEGVKGDDLRTLLVWVGITLAVALLPWGSTPLRGVATAATVGMGLIINAGRTGKGRLINGMGIALLLWGISILHELADVRDALLYAGAAFLGAHMIAEYAKSHKWGPRADASIIPIGLLGGFIGLYVDFNGRLMRGYPSLAFYGKWASLAGALVVAAVWAYSTIPEGHPEKAIKEGSLSKGIPSPREEVVREFILSGRKAGLISYIAHYGRDALSTRKDLERVLSKIDDYREARIPKLMPPWLKRAYARREVERRRKIVEEILEEIDLLVKGGQ